VSLNDKTLTCRDCGEHFVWTSGEQEFYINKGLTKQPSRCPDCRSATKSDHSAKRDARPIYNIVCCDCHAELKLHFQPKSPDSFRCKACQERYKNRPMYEVTCCDCGQNLTLPFQPKNLTSFRCKDCKAKRESMMYEVECSYCATTFRVPFKPDYSRPIYCRDCKKAGNKIMYQIICNGCYQEIDVPFEPDPSRIFYCEQCRANRDGQRRRGERPSWRNQEPQWGPHGENRRETAWTYNSQGERYQKRARGPTARELGDY
jgi:CxxC-x17-CxxC domain-containing protein